MGCDLHATLAAGFTADDHALTAAVASPPPAAPTTELADGHVRVDVPTAWFPARVDGGAFTAYQVRTGHDDDLFGIYLGNTPAFRPHAGDEFRLTAGAIAMRGTVWREGATQHLEALALLPCETPRYVHVWMHTDAPDRFAQMVTALRSLRLVPEVRASLHEVAVDATHDAAALAALTASDPLARELATRALAGEGLRAAYPLDTVHPLADQGLFGRYETDLGGAPAQVWVRISVRDGHATAAPVFRALTDGSLAREVPSLARAGCRAQQLIVAHDGIAVHCAGEPEVRAATSDESDAAALPHALANLLHARATLARWRRDPSTVGPWPASLCESDHARVVPDAGTLYLTLDRCVLALDPAHETVLAAAMEGECGQVPVAPWSTTLRSVGRFDEVRGANGTYCRYTLGWNGRSSWVIAVGDEGTRSAPIAQAPTVAVDPRAVNTAVAFLHDLLRYASGDADEPPANVRPSVLRAIGADRPGSAALASVLRLFRARGGMSSAEVSAVLGARALEGERVEVTFVPVVVELTEEQAGWVVTAMRPTAFAATH